MSEMSDKDREIVDFWGLGKRANSSTVWKHFGFYVDTRGYTVKDEAICRHCRTPIKYKGNTTNLNYHLQRYHISFLSEEERGFPRMLRESTPNMPTFLGTEKYPVNSPHTQLLAHRVGEYLITDLMPLSTVQSHGFRTLLEAFDPKFSLPSLSYFADSIIPSLHAKAKSLILPVLARVKAVAITMDSWTSADSENYITVTAHFIDDWELKNCVLHTRLVPDNPSAEKVAALLQTSFYEWALPRSSIVAGITNNSENYAQAWKLLEHAHVPCFGHALNKAVQCILSLNHISHLLRCVRNLVAHFSHNPTFFLKLTEKQNLLQLPVQELICDVQTKWLSTYNMIERILEQQPAICAVLYEGPNEFHNLMLEPHHVLQLEELRDLLKPMKESTVMMRDESAVTISLLGPTLYKFLSIFLPAQPDESPLCREAKETMKYEFEQQYNSEIIQNFLNMSSFLDPRFKKLAFLDEKTRNNTLGQIKLEASKFAQRQDDGQVHVKQEYSDDGSDTEKLDNSLPQEQNMTMLVEKTINKIKKETSHLGSSSLEGQPPAKRQRESDSFFDSFFGEVIEPAINLTPFEKASREVERYLTDPVPKISNPLLWWKDHEVLFPLLSGVARQYLCVPATSSETVFNTTNLDVSNRRIFLSPDSVDRFVFLNKNYQKFNLSGIQSTPVALV